MTDPLFPSLKILPLLLVAGLMGCQTMAVRPDPLSQKESQDLPPSAASSSSSSGLPSHRRKVSPEAYKHFLRGRLNSLEGRSRKAIEEYKLALIHDDRSPYLETVLGREYRRLDRLDLALKACESALKLDDSFVEALLEEGRIQREREAFDEALKPYERVRTLKPELALAYLGLAEIHMKLKHWKAAEEVYRQMIRAIPQSYDAHVGLAELLRERKSFDEALRNYKEAVAIRPSAVDTLLRLASLSEFMGDREGAIEAYRSCLDYVGDSLDLYLNLLRLYMKIGNRTMVEHYTAKVEEEGTLKAHLSLGQLYLDEERPREAAALFRKTMEESKDERVRYFLALALFDLMRLKEAERILAPLKGDSRLQRQINILRSAGAAVRGEREAARTLKDRGLALCQGEEQRVESYLLLGEFLDRLNRRDLAVEVLSEAVQVLPREESLRYALATIQEKMGHDNDAIETLRALLKLNPNHPGALNFLGYTLALQGKNLDEAEKLILKALEIHPLDGYMTDSLGWVYFKQGRLEKALETLTRASHLAPGEAVIHQHLGECSLALGDREEARSHLERALELDPDKKARGEILDRLRSMGLSPEARKEPR